jgi:uncharacterized protein YqgC (DUF456 family)
VTIALYGIGVCLMLVGLAGLLLPVVPGAPLMFLGIVCVAWADGFERIGFGELLIAAGVASLIVVVELAAQLLGAKRFGASRWGVAGAVLGAVVGVFFGLPGIVLGPIVGAMSIELIRQRDLERAGRVGLGTLVGFVFGKAIEYALALALIALTIFFWAN